jgi:molybdopterin-binding protein
LEFVQLCAGRTKIEPRASRDRFATPPIAYRLVSGYFTQVWLVEIKCGKDHVMKLSARNQLKGTIVDVVKGATTSHIRIDIGGGVIVTASITNEAVDELKLAKGKAAIAVIKASDVMVGVD